MESEADQEGGVNTMSDVPFTPFPKIPRLKREITITEKIDGTNASILVPVDEGPLLIGSRNRWITPEHDNAGFAAWVRANEEALRAELGLGHHFGEWWGPAIQRRYNIAQKRFSLFNTHRWQDASLKLCSVVPVLYQGPWTQEAIDGCLERLRTEGSVAAPGFMNPEGIVVYHSASRGLYKVTLKSDDKPKSEVRVSS